MNQNPVKALIEQQVSTCAAVAQELLRQRDFFDFHRDHLPASRRELPAPRYTGARSDDEATNLRVGAMRLLGFSDRAIERECGVDHRTIPHRIDWCVQTNRIPAQKERLLQRVGEVAEKSGIILNCLLNRAHEGECSTDLASMIKAVATSLGITVEKVQLLTGSPTEILETRAGAGREEIEAWWREHAVQIEATVTPTSDSASTQIATELQQTSHSMAVGHEPDTSGSPDACTEAGGPRPEQQEGGGCAPPTGGEKGDGSTAL